MQQIYSDRIHGKYYPPSTDARVPRRYVRICSHLARLLGKGAVGPILEIGPENAAVSSFVRASLSLPSDGYIGVDISIQAVDSLLSAGIKGLVADVSTDRLPFGTNSMRAVVMSEVLEHLVDPDHALEEVLRVLAPGGFAVVTTPNLAAWFNRFILLLGLQPVFSETGTEWNLGWGSIRKKSRPVGHLRLFTLKSLLETLQLHGLDPKVIEGLPMDGPIASSVLLGWIDALLAAFPSLGAGELVVACKSIHSNPISESSDP